MATITIHRFTIQWTIQLLLLYICLFAVLMYVYVYVRMCVCMYSHFVQCIVDPFQLNCPLSMLSAFVNWYLSGISLLTMLAVIIVVILMLAVTALLMPSWLAANGTGRIKNPLTWPINSRKDKGLRLPMPLTQFRCCSFVGIFIQSTSSCSSLYSNSTV